MYILRSKRPELWRPMYVAAIGAAVAYIGLLVAREFDSSVTLGVAAVIAAFVFFIGVVRVLIWWFTAGRTMVRVSDESVLVRGRFRTVRLEPRDVRSAYVLPGERRPEWSHWAVHPRIVFELQDGRQVSRQVLLDSNSALHEGPRLQTAITHAAKRRGSRRRTGDGQR